MVGKYTSPMDGMCFAIQNELYRLETPSFATKAFPPQ